MDKLIGRDKEYEELKRCLHSDRSELVIVYGRRRIGKTFLIEEFFGRQFDFILSCSRLLRAVDGSLLGSVTILLGI